MSDVVVRLLERGDVRQIAPFANGIQRDEFGVAVTAEEQPDLIDPISFFRHGVGDFWVALDGERVIGTIGLLDIGDRMSALRKMFVAQEYRGAEIGVAQRLVDALIASARKHELLDIYLGTTDKFRAAHRFYEKNGFTEVPANELPAAFPRMTVDTKFYRMNIG